MGNQRSEPTDFRRLGVLILAIGLIVVWFLLRSRGDGSAEFIAEASGRIGLTFAALWLAWPSLRRPASWLPPGGAVLCIIVLAVLAARPKLFVVAIPALGVLLALATIVRAINR